MVYEFFTVTLAISIIFIGKLLDKNPVPILDIYQRPNGFYWLKVALISIILIIKQKLYKLKHKLGGNNNEEIYAKIDRPQPLSYHDNAVDAVYFNGANRNGDHLIVGMARRKNRLVDGFLYLLIKNSNFGLLETPKLPGTVLYQNDDIDGYSAEGIQLVPIVPMKKWRIVYRGFMKLYEDRQKTVYVEIDAEFISTLPYFNFDTDMDAVTTAKAMARELWSREYFNNLKMSHQTHYEQHGDICGVAKIDGIPQQIEMNCVRDHSYGLKREWRDFHRYGLHFVTTENGDRFSVGIICVPVTFSSIAIGYVYRAEDKKIYPVQSCDLALYQHGENGAPPVDYAFSFTAGNRKYVMQVDVVNSPHFYLSKDWESKVMERLCRFDVNGLEGWGAAEWQYRNVNETQVADFNQ